VHDGARLDAKLKPEFDSRNVKVIGLSVDPVESHVRWSNDIKETQGYAPNYPMIPDPDLKVSELFGMLPATLDTTCDGRPTCFWRRDKSVRRDGPSALT
jgi:alkyl hydroperoxide reductase subunit AhpC